MLLTDEAPMATRADPAFRADVLAGLRLPQKAIPARWFYDRRGSELFEEITALPEYYPTRAETAILHTICPELVGAVGDGVAVVEFGSGSSVKTPIVLNCIEPAAYVPIDISGDFLRSSSAALAKQFPGLPVLPVEADFMKPVPLPAEVADMPKLGFFPGSTIGNMEPQAATTLLAAMRDWLGEGALLLIGIDRIKDAAILTAAYDDAAGVTAAFNLNLLERINRELNGTVPIDAFVHEARWNDDAARIEMHLKAVRDIRFTIDGHDLSMTAGETIHTENSHKYSDRDARLLLRAGGWTPRQQWCGTDGAFCVILAEARPLPIAP
ncbi:dimethylhistidine N-methyltransferase [Sphingomonas sp. Leaf407]|uniref:L-histidine N(alpha)-methyltransferase n=1 Tax=unclassified Sphingomonas TaxID=196159 RepID=UPI0006FE4555|nr:MULTISPECIES: L-histidine N(alpha)-methyltransferase [unclassified Sphingomonas]KQN37326.1 dimethylhistidine N-methyltransferase [Sphingomonas sp. Leaf42]KQT27695.1 dimethylhistidine N-methyltransferase [Sphingomonas sp. Leaf407]